MIGGRVFLDKDGKVLETHRIDPHAGGTHNAKRVDRAHGYRLDRGVIFNRAKEFTDQLGEQGVAITEAMMALPIEQQRQLAAIDDFEERGKALAALLPKPAATDDGAADGDDHQNT